jgi:hypothetical protein
MKRVFAWVVTVALFCPFAIPSASGDMIPPYPRYPERPKEMQKHRPAYPAYAIGAGVVAVALSGSLVALRVIRKRNGNGPS